MSDADLGGHSSSSLEFVPADHLNPSHVRFAGNVSIELPEDRPKLRAAGYVGWRTKDRKRNVFGKGLWNLDQYRYIAMRIKSDGRKYYINMQADGIEPTDLHQHRVYVRKPGNWETIVIGLDDFVRTNNGALSEPQSEMLKQKIRSIGLSLTDRLPGPYRLLIERIWATNQPEPYTHLDPE